MNCKDIDVKVGNYILFKDDLGRCGVADKYQHYGGTVHQVTVVFSGKDDLHPLNFETGDMHWQKNTIEKIVYKSVNPEYFL